MHILFLSDNFPPEVNAPASRTFEHCREWVRRGHRVTVVTCAPNFPKGKVFAGYRNRLWQREQVDGIEVIRVWSYITANEGFAKRVADYVSYAGAAFVASLFVRRCDIVVGTSPQFFTAVAAWAVGAVKRVPFLFELRDLWPESIKAVGAMQSSRAIEWLERLELFLYRRAARIVSVTHAFRDNLIRRGIDGDKISVVTNGVDVERFRPMPKDPALVEKLDLGGQFVAGYIGTHGMAHALGTLLDAAHLLKERRIRLLLLGDGAEKGALVERAAREGLDNMIFVDTVTKDEVSRYWSVLDVSVIHLKATELFTTVIPSKMFESMGMGIPIVHGVAGESARIVDTTQAGVCFASEDARQLAETLMRLSESPEELASLRRNCLAAAPRFDRSRLAGDMLEVMEATVAGAR
ncbi:MAG: glycosyltransferase family 4 protein [Sphingomonadaceae bacterium]|nr:glycosyltransferase family 4 protein [Sphingomonadaceae bacterium]